MGDAAVAVGEGVEVAVGVAVGSTPVEHARTIRGSIPIKRMSPLKRLRERGAGGNVSLIHRRVDTTVEMAPEGLLRSP